MKNTKKKRKSTKNTIKKKTKNNSIAGYDLFNTNIFNNFTKVKHNTHTINKNNSNVTHFINDTPKDLQKIGIENNKTKNNEHIFYYKPVIYSLIGDSISSFSPQYNVFDNIIECSNEKINIKNNKYNTNAITAGENINEITAGEIIDNFYENPMMRSPDFKCLKYNDNEIIQILLRNSKKKYFNPDKIICPQQIQANCWFNTGLMIYFFSQEGKRYNRYIRYSMITGNLINQKQYNFDMNKMKKILFIFNLYIDACLQGELFCTQIDTNYLIHQIYSLSKNTKYKTFKSGEYGNPTTFYDNLINILGLNQYETTLKTYSIHTKNENNLHTYNHVDFSNIIQNIRVINIVLKPIEVIIINIFEPLKNKDAPINNLITNKPTTIEFKTNNGIKYKYKLDAVLLRSINKSHFCCAITMNKEEYLYDGASYSKLIKQNWSDDYLNKDKTFSFELGSKKRYYGSEFNFLRGYQQLFYYRIH